MARIKQNNIYLKKIIQEVGCCFISLINIAQNKANKDLSVDQINTMWDWCKKTGRINSDNNVTDNASIINRAYAELGMEDGRFYEIGIFKEGVLTYYPSIKPEFRKPVAWMQKIKQNGPNKTHFRLVDKYGEVIEDPHTPPIMSQGIIHTVLFTFA